MRLLRTLATLCLVLSAGQALAEAGQPASAEAPHYVKMQPVVLPLIGPKGIEQIVAITVALEVISDENEDKVKGREPKLTDAYMRDLYGALDRRRLLHDQILDVEAVKAMLMRATDRIVGEGVVKGVMLQHVAQRPI